MTKQLNIFIHNNRHYIRAVPVKALFKSNLIHSVITRGDVFAICIETGEFTVIPGTAQVVHIKADISWDPVQLEMDV